MNYFITSETTFDVTDDELLVLREINDSLVRVASDLQISGVDHVGVVLVVMNPEVAPPFPAGVIFRRARKELDIKPAINFAQWKAADRHGRIDLLIKAVAAVLNDRHRKSVSDHDILALETALRHAARVLLN